MEKEKINQYIIGYSTDIHIKIMKVYIRGKITNTVQKIFDMFEFSSGPLESIFDFV